MTLLYETDSTAAIIRRLIGENEPYAPVDGEWSEVSYELFEELSRSLAYGMMVKKLKRGTNVSFTGFSKKEQPFITAGCRMANINPIFEAGTEGTAQITPDTIETIMKMGSVWSSEYKPIVDRTLRTIAG